MFRNALRTSLCQRYAFNSTLKKPMSSAVDWHGTTIICVRKDGKVAMAGDGQVSAGPTVVKGNARKVRRLTDNILVGFAGSTADALTLVERLEKKLEEHPGQVMLQLCRESAHITNIILFVVN